MLALIFLVACCLSLTAAQLVTTLAGGGAGGSTPGSANGDRLLDALYNGPRGVAMGPGGIVYVTDSLNHKIRAIYPNQSVTTLAGGDATGSASGSANGAGSSALFSLPWGISVDTSGVVYVADTFNNKIRAIYPNQSVITLVGGGVTGMAMGFADGIGSGALFSGPSGVAVGPTGIVYASDSNNNRICAIYPNLTVTTFAGGPSFGFIDGTWATARFNQPYGVAVGNSGIVYVADLSNNKIRAIFPGNRSVITLAGGSSTGTMSGSVDGIGSGALFDRPYSVSADSYGTVYVADLGNHKIRAIFANLTVVTLTGGSLSGVTSGSINGIGPGALFNGPLDVFVDPTGTLYVADSGNHKIRAISQDRSVTTFSGGGEALGGRLRGLFDGIGTGASFNAPRGTAVGPGGIVYVVDAGNNKIRAIFSNQSVITLVGGNATGSTAGSVNGIGSGALFSQPWGVSVDTSGVMFVADTGNNKIRAVYPNLTAITLAGGGVTGTDVGFADGIGSGALFNNPRGIAVGVSGIAYVADTFNHRIRAVYPNRTVITIAGNWFGTMDGIGTFANFNTPSGLAVGPSGIIYVADSSNYKIRIVFPSNRSVITLAGGSMGGNLMGFANGVGTSALIGSPYAVAVDAAGIVYVSDSDYNNIRAILPNRTVATFAGGSTTGTASGSINGVGSGALFLQPYGVSVGASGVVYVVDQGNHKIRAIHPPTCPAGSHTPPGTLQCVPCPAGSFSAAAASTACAACPGGHACPPGTASWARLNCGRGHYCPAGASAPTPCPALVPPAGGGWGALRVQGPAFLVETARCLSHCFWNSSSADGGGGALSAC